MADFNDLNDATRTATFVDDEGGDSVVVDTAATPRPTANGEASKIIRYDFTVDFQELQDMTKAEIWDMYIQEVVRDIVKQAKKIQARLGRQLEFRSFSLPANNARRRVFTYERKGIFVGIMFRRIDQDQGDGRTNDEVEVIVQAEIGLQSGESLPDVEPETQNHADPPRNITKWERFKGWNQ